jgi:hypothetical protein
LIELLVGVKREGVWVVFLAADLQLLKTYFGFTELAFDL